MSEDVNEHKRSRDFSDLQNEIAGRDVGRQRRFLSSEDDPRGGNAEGKAAKEKLRAWTTLQTLMMNDPEYAALYHSVSEDVTRAEMALYSAELEAEQEASEAEAKLLAIQARAGTLPDGTRVYRSETGDVFTEEGERLEPGAEEDITWQDNPPSWEEYQTVKERSDAAVQAMDNLDRYKREVLQPARDRLEDADNPLSKDELEQIQRDIEEKAPPAVRERMELTGDTPDSEPAAAHEIGVPKL